MSDVVDLIHATVRLEQPQPDGTSTVGTGFVVIEAAPDGAPRTVLVTAQHVFERMPGDKAKVGFRAQEGGGWRYAPLSVRIRDAAGDPLWSQHPTQDVAAIELPAGAARSALPAADLAGARALANLRIEPGEEMMVLGFPRGYSANAAGFPILRSGKVASYPLSPASRYPTFLLDFAVFPGNSGGPVYIVRSGPGGVGRRVIVTGLLTQEIKLKADRLEIGNVTQADYVVETLSLLDGSPTETAPTQGALPQSDAIPAAGGPEPTAMDRLRDAWLEAVSDFRILVRRAWIVVREHALNLVTPPARRT